MRTVVISDLHLGTVPGNDVLRVDRLRARLFEALDGIDRLVLLGDTAELREAPVGPALAAAREFASQLNEALAGRQVVIAAGNHDHPLVAGWLEARRLEPDPEPLPPDACIEAPHEGPVGALARRMPDCDVRLAYPGLWLRDDVYATHGHYLDLHMAIPTLETIAASAFARFEGHRRDRLAGPDDYEAVLAPIYSLVYATVQGRRRSARPVASGASVRMWGRMYPDDPDLPARVRALALRRGLIPAVTATLNAAGLGPFDTDLSGAALRRAGVAAMARAASHLAPDARWVVYGHTHRAGPLPGEGEWRTATGGRLVNTGSWIWAPQLASGSEGRGPYWPGTMVAVDEDGPPRLERVLEDVAESDMPQPTG